MITKILKFSKILFCWLLVFNLTNCKNFDNSHNEKPKTQDEITFAVLGDFGASFSTPGVPDASESSVAKLINENFCPDFIINVGDNNYNALNQLTYRKSVGNYYGDYGVKSNGTNFTPRKCPESIDGIKFYPVPGNCDVAGACTNADAGNYTDLDAYSEYFYWANNDSALNDCDLIISKIQAEYPNYACPKVSNYENLFYDFKKGSVHFFALNTYCPEAHKNGGCFNKKIPENKDEINNMLGDPSVNSCIKQYLTQMIWMQFVAKHSDSIWKIAFFHNPPFSSGDHGSCQGLQFDYQSMGIDLVLSGHNHSYNRISFAQNDPYQNEYVFVTAGLGGASSSTSGCASSVAGDDKLLSNILYESNHGAIKATASDDKFVLGFYQIEDWNQPVDEIVLKRDGKSIQTTYCPNGCSRESINICKSE